MSVSKRHKRIIGCLIVLGVLGPGTTVFAGPPRGHHGFFHGPDPLFELIVVGTRHLFFRGGAFYHKGPAGYALVEAPEGAVIPVLPPGYGIRVVDDAKYYYFNGIYYARVPAGYMVVAPPVLIASGETDEARTVKYKGEVSVTADMLNVRSGPGMKYEVGSLAYKGDTLKIYHELNGWLYVELPSGKLGWVDRRYTKPLKRVPVG